MDKLNYTYSEQTKPCDNLEDELNRLAIIALFAGISKIYNKIKKVV